MNRIELKTKLDKLGISNDMYSLDGFRELDQKVLENNYKWKVYGIDERGGIHNEQSFNTEGEACEYFYNEMHSFKMTMDAIARRPPYVRPAAEEKRIFIASTDGDIRMAKEDGDSETVNDKQ